MRNRTKVALVVALFVGGAALAHPAHEAPARSQDAMQTRGAMGQEQMTGQMGQGGPMMTAEMRQGMAGMMQNCPLMSRMGAEGRPPQPRR